MNAEGLTLRERKIAKRQAQARAVAAKRPNGSTCICGTAHYGDWDGAWRKNWCGNQCCWNRETCRSCGAVYEAVSGVLVAGKPKPPKQAGDHLIHNETERS